LVEKRESRDSSTSVMQKILRGPIAPSAGVGGDEEYENYEKDRAKLGTVNTCWSIRGRGRRGGVRKGGQIMS